jgi:hypothetical protein
MRAHIYASQLVGCGEGRRRHREGLSVGGICALLYTHTQHHHTHSTLPALTALPSATTPQQREHPPAPREQSLHPVQKVEAV